MRALKSILFFTITAAAIIYGLIPEHPEGMARIVGNAIYWWALVIGWLSLIAGLFSLSDTGKKEMLAQAKTIPTERRIMTLFMAAAGIALLLAAAGHPWLATLWVLGALCRAGARYDARRTLDGSSEEDAESRPA